MAKVIMALFVIVISAVSSPSLAKDKACLVQALQDYAQLKTAVLAQPGAEPIWSPEIWVDLRRLQEAYCNQFAYCMVGDPKKDSTKKIPFAAEFSRCLRDEALEQYGGGEQ